MRGALITNIYTGKVKMNIIFETTTVDVDGDEVYFNVVQNDDLFLITVSQRHGADTTIILSEDDTRKLTMKLLETGNFAPVEEISEISSM
jgi:hypothetical protein